MRAFVVRVASPDDFDGVGALLRASYPELMRAAYDADELAPALELMTKPNPTLLASETFYIAESSEDEIIGCGGWTRERPGEGCLEPGVAHLRHFGTHPGWTRRGVGRALYERCELEAKAAGVSRFECYASLNAQRFYESLGFEPLRPLDCELDAGVVLGGMFMQRLI
ncbi:MAG TPA: GNAT family N-acetyltransferase [Gammaproteobacteria bacterium]